MTVSLTECATGVTRADKGEIMRSVDDLTKMLVDVNKLLKELGDDVTIEINAPVAMMQVELKARRAILKWVLSLKVPDLKRTLTIEEMCIEWPDKAALYIKRVGNEIKELREGYEEYKDESSARLINAVEKLITMEKPTWEELSDES